jgi:hypothetical protein
MRTSGPRQYDGDDLKATNNIISAIDEARPAPSFALWRGLTPEMTVRFHPEQ